MILCGYELGKRWYTDLKIDVELFQRLKKKEEIDREKIYKILDLPERKDGADKLYKISTYWIKYWDDKIKEQRQNLEAFTNAIKSLPEKRQRDFCIYHYINGKTIEETAEIMGCSTTTTHEIRKLAIKGLKKYMDTQTAQ